MIIPIIEICRLLLVTGISFQTLAWNNIKNEKTTASFGRRFVHFLTLIGLVMIMHSGKYDKLDATPNSCCGKLDLVNRKQEFAWQQFDRRLQLPRLMERGEIGESHCDWRQCR